MSSSLSNSATSCSQRLQVRQFWCLHLRDANSDSCRESWKYSPPLLGFATKHLRCSRSWIASGVITRVVENNWTRVKTSRSAEPQWIHTWPLRQGCEQQRPYWTEMLKSDGRELVSIPLNWNELLMLIYYSNVSFKCTKSQGRVD